MKIRILIIILLHTGLKSEETPTTVEYDCSKPKPKQPNEEQNNTS